MEQLTVRFGIYIQIDAMQNLMFLKTILLNNNPNSFRSKPGLLGLFVKEIFKISISLYRPQGHDFEYVLLRQEGHRFCQDKSLYQGKTIDDIVKLWFIVQTKGTLN